MSHGFFRGKGDKNHKKLLLNTYKLYCQFLHSVVECYMQNSVTVGICTLRGLRCRRFGTARPGVTVFYRPFLRLH